MTEAGYLVGLDVKRHMPYALPLGEKKVRYPLFPVIILLAPCASLAEEQILEYETPAALEDFAVFHGEDSPKKFLGKGHEQIFVCEVDGALVPSAAFDLPVSVTPSLHTITVCYKEGLNTAKAAFEITLKPSTEYQLKLGKHSYTKVNFWIEDKKSGEKYVALTTVPKKAGDVTIVIFD